MTEQEAETLAARFERVWGLENLLSSNWFFEEAVFDWFAQLSKDILVRLTCGRGVHPPVASLSQGNRYIYLSEYSQMTVCPTQEDAAQLVTQWLPFFRRNCWLSSCAIEASAEEKAEWMEGFSREEIEAWNLKF